MIELKRISRHELAALLGVSYATYRKIARAHGCSFSLGVKNGPKNGGRMPLLTLAQVAEAIIKLNNQFERPPRPAVIAQAREFLYKHKKKIKSLKAVKNLPN